MRTAAERLYAFVHTVQFKREIFFDTEKITRIGIEQELKLRVEKKITCWHRENIVDIFLETFLKIHGERFKKIHERLHVIKDDMQGIKIPFTANPRIAAVLASSIGSSGTRLLGSLVVSLFPKNPYAPVGVATVGILGGMLAERLALDVHADFDTIRENAFKCITDTFSGEKMWEGMRTSYEHVFKTITSTFIDEELQKEICRVNKNIDTMLDLLDDCKKEEAVLRFLSSKISRYVEELNVVFRMKIRSI